MCPPYGVVFSSKGCLILCELSSPPPPAPRSPPRRRPQPRLCELSVPCRTSTAIMWAQCSLPDSNPDPVSSVFRAAPVSHSCVIWQSKPVEALVALTCQGPTPWWPGTARMLAWVHATWLHSFCWASTLSDLSGQQQSGTWRNWSFSWYPTGKQWSKLWGSWCVTCSIPVPNCDDVSSAFLARPQPRSCELSGSLHTTWVLDCALHENNSYAS